MTVVQGKLIGVASPGRVEMKATLVDVTGKPAVGYVASVPGEVVKEVPIQADDDGDWSVTLTGNAGIESDAGDTLWAVMEGRALDGTPILTYVLVPETGGPYWAGNIRADLSDTISGVGTVVFLPGPTGATGPQGVAGPAGPTGATGPEGPPGQDASLTDAQEYTDQAVTTHAAAADPHGDRAWADNKFATITVVTTLSGNVNDLDVFVNDALNRVAAIENGTAFLAGVNSTGPVVVSGADLRINGTGKAYRLRRGGDALDFEAAGSDLLLSVWANGDFTGAQRSYDRYAAGAFAAQHAGKREFVSALYGAVRHVIDPDADQLGFHGQAPVSRQVVNGSRGGNAALESLLAALDAVGLIDDQTTA